MMWEVWEFKSPNMFSALVSAKFNFWGFEVVACTFCQEVPVTPGCGADGLLTGRGLPGMSESLRRWARDLRGHLHTGKTGVREAECFKGKFFQGCTGAAMDKAGEVR